jgi:hypothetical protein
VSPSTIYRHDGSRAGLAPAPSASEGGRKALRGPSLDQRTNFDGRGGGGAIRHRMMLRRYPCGNAERSLTEVHERVARRPVERIDPETGEVLPGRAEKTPYEAVAAKGKAADRSRTSVRRAIMAGGFDHFGTLTYARNEQDLQTAWRAFTRFLRLLRDHYGEVFPYVAVAERQKRGAWHFHLALLGRQDVRLLRRLWHLASGDTGNIDVKKWQGPLHKMASYLSKYMSKSFTAEEIEGRRPHRFRRSQGLSPETFVEEVTIDARRAHDTMAMLFAQHGLLGCALVTKGQPGDLEYFTWGSTWTDPPDP